MKEIGWHIITSGLQFGMTDKIGSFKVHRLAEMTICVMKHPTCSGTSTILSAIYLQILNLSTMRSVLLQCCTSFYHAYLFMAMTLLFILQYDMSQEPSQPASQPYTGHSGLLQILYVIPNNFLDTRLWIMVKCLDIHTISLAAHQTPNSNMSLPRTVSSCISQVIVLVKL